MDGRTDEVTRPRNKTYDKIINMLERRAHRTLLCIVSTANGWRIHDPKESGPPAAGVVVMVTEQTGLGLAKLSIVCTL